MSPNTPFPTTPEEVTSEWVEKMLIENIPNSTKVKIDSLETESEDKKSGTLSTISRVNCVVTFDDESRVDEDHKIFIKIMPKNERFRQFANGSKMDKTEIETYKLFLPEMEKFEIEKIGHTAMRISPRLYAGDYDLNEETRSWFVALEDLSQSHLMPDFGKGLTLNQLTVALEKLAHFHALTYSYGKTKGIKNFEEKFDFFNQIFKNFESDPEVSEIINESMININRDLSQDPKLQYLIPKLEGFREKMNHVFATLVQRKDADVVIHGDIWANNYLFSRSDDSDCFMVDWQFTSTGNPLFDFGPVAFLSMNPAETETNLDSIMKSYFNHYKETCLSLGLQEDELLWKSFEDFQAEAKKVGLYITFVWSVISYEVVKMYPPMRQRYLWVLKTSCDLHPELFNGGN